MIASDDVYTFVLPFIPVSRPGDNLRLGTHIEGNPKNQVEFLHPDAVVRRWLDWSSCQPESYTPLQWPQDEPLAYLTEYDTILCVKNTPYWASIDKNIRCSPPKPNCIKRYAQFIDAVIERYHPYAIEIYNEPEGSGFYLVSCFGNDGTYYGEIVKEVYEYIKPRHPSVKIFAGALHQDCSEEWTKDFLDAAAGCFDVLSYHSYVYKFSDALGSALLAPLATADNLRSMTDKPLWLTETSLLYDIRTDAKDQEQGEYLAYLLEHAADYGIVGVSWYPLTSNNWRNSDMMWGCAPKPAYKVWRAWLERRSI